MVSEIVQNSGFSNGTSVSPGDRGAHQKGAVLMFLKERRDCWTVWLLQCMREWATESEWMSEWVIEWRAKADNMLTDWQREATAISIDRHRTRPAASAGGGSTGLRGTARRWIISPHDCISGQRFHLIQCKVLGFELLHNIYATAESALIKISRDFFFFFTFGYIVETPNK